ncbi:MAG: hypothetical protein DHS20C16_18860 [Phycisphaerae bacterium]|nr:MAG: hypothetical protein DHS20C16_18860 [Phycisphaerae bacterium]
MFSPITIALAFFLMPRLSVNLAFQVMTLFVLIVLGIRYLIQLHGDRRGELVVDRKGVHAIYSNGESKSVTWDHVNRAEYNWLTGRLIVLNLEGRKLLSVPIWKFGERCVGTNCAVLIAAHLVDYELGREMENANAEE